MRQSVGRFGERMSLRIVGGLAALAAVGIWSGAGVEPARAQTLLEETGTIVPAEQRYTFDGTAGQSVTITLASEDFDSVVLLQNAAGEEIAANDDFGGTLNSTVIVTLPENGTYTVVARSFAGNGGDYQLAVRISTPFEITYSKAMSLVQENQYEAAIAAYTDAIAIDDSQPSAYLGRAEAYLTQVYVEQGEDFSG
ncbi:MAG TPA: tetratricopeptide repeat protein, partial [Trichocoleus sp.]